MKKSNSMIKSEPFKAKGFVLDDEKLKQGDVLFGEDYFAESGKLPEEKHIDESKEEPLSSFNKSLKQALDNNPKESKED